METKTQALTLDIGGSSSGKICVHPDFLEVLLNALKPKSLDGVISSVHLPD